MNEDDLVRSLRERFSPRIGDDAAVVGPQVFTTDMLVEDVDFTAATPLDLVARKSLAVNLSDIAAMGARPRYALLAIAIPRSMTDRLPSMIDAWAAAAREHSIEIIGGDLSRGDKLVISVTMIGEVCARPLLRSGARPGDRVYLSRPIGAAAAGLQLLQSGISGNGYAERELVESLIRRHLDPEPEVALGMKLAAIDEVTACIDLSDGLSTDLNRLCEASAVGARIEKGRIPLFPDLEAHVRSLKIDLRQCVLHGGEDFALLFTSSLTESEMSRRAGRPLFAIGRITTSREVLLADGEQESPFPPAGWDHFRSGAEG
jgi:thiamine-monophosphate kinase